jgi:hypothetical protein
MGAIISEARGSLGWMWKGSSVASMAGKHRSRNQCRMSWQQVWPPLPRSGGGRTR